MSSNEHPTDEVLISALGRGPAAPPIAYGLPPEMLDSGVRRLGSLSLGFAATLAVILMLRWGAIVSGWQGLGDALVGGDAGLATSAALIVLSLAMLLTTRTARFDRGWVLDLGLIYAVVCCFGIAMLENFVVWPEPGPVRGASWVCMWVVVFPLIVPATPGKIFLTSAASAAMGPLAFAATILAGKPSPGAATVTALFAPNFAALWLAVVGARILHRLGTQVSRAQRLGNYRLVERIGRGGMGEVWMAEHPRLARRAAVKFIRGDRMQEESADVKATTVRRFEREARATAMLRSPHTVQLFDFGVSDDGIFYYVMELLTGLDLESMIRRFGPVPPCRAVYFLRQACHSLGEAHQAGLIHRDIKPANLFACRLGADYDFLKILDFGLVRSTMSTLDSVDKLTEDSIIGGTPAYLPPESLIRGRKVDQRADLYAIGCVAYWLLTGVLVFEDEDPIRVVMAHMNEEPMPLAQRTEVDIPQDLEAIIMSCLAKNPADRPDNAAEVGRLLDACDIVDPWTNERAEKWWRLHMPSIAAPLESRAGETLRGADRN